MTSQEEYDNHESHALLFIACEEVYVPDRSTSHLCCCDLASHHGSILSDHAHMDALDPTRNLNEDARQVPWSTNCSLAPSPPSAELYRYSTCPPHRLPRNLEMGDLFGSKIGKPPIGV